MIDSFGRMFRDRLQTISGMDQLHVYMNFAHGDEGAVAWYSTANIPRLRALKQRFDSGSIFSFYNPVTQD